MRDLCKNRKKHDGGGQRTILGWTIDSSAFWPQDSPSGNTGIIGRLEAARESATARTFAASSRHDDGPVSFIFLSQTIVGTLSKLWRSARDMIGGCVDETLSRLFVVGRIVKVRSK
eukprot:GABV01013111.1.p2 GENE.GABV01013111.1~~GABV01013111.1.p2  ORF type:complete len:116 (-),score=13.49 GABV01013111.1:75-422(-)